jgi:hypothetical protein
MTRKVWFWFLVGWLASLAFSPKSVMGMFTAKKSG